MPSQLVIRRLALALMLSFALSIAFWIVFHVFVLAGFLIWSVVAALAGAAIGYFGFRNLIGTAVATVVIRIGIFLVMTPSVIAQ